MEQEPACAVAEHVGRGVETLRLHHEGNPFGVATSRVGITHALTVETNAQTLFREADKALYEATRAGRNQVR
jgi:PleD family two-component response regulator